MTQIQAGHAETALDAELRQAGVASLLAREQARDAARGLARPQASSTAARPTLEQPRPKAPTPPPKTPPPAPPSVTLPPGSVVLSAAEMAAVDRLLATHPETKHLFTPGEETR